MWLVQYTLMFACIRAGVKQLSEPSERNGETERAREKETKSCVFFRLRHEDNVTERRIAYTHQQMKRTQVHRVREKEHTQTTLTHLSYTQLNDGAGERQ